MFHQKIFYLSTFFPSIQLPLKHELDHVIDPVSTRAQVISSI